MTTKTHQPSATNRLTLNRNKVIALRLTDYGNALLAAVASSTGHTETSCARHLLMEKLQQEVKKNPNLLKHHENALAVE